MQVDFVRIIESALKAKSAWSAVIPDRLAEFDRLCLAQLRDESLRNVVTAFLVERVPLDFYCAPASSTGKNHPSWQKSVGGILLNTVECCIAIDRKMRIYPELTDSTGIPNSKDRDVLYAATMLSDTFKPEDYGKEWSQWNHHIRAAEEFARFASARDLDRSWIEPIRDAIFWHLGRFTPNRQNEMVNPRLTLSLTAFIAHELDMDFSNRFLDEVFIRKGVSVGDCAPELPSNFVLQELSSTTTYFSQVETKMVSLVTLYATLVVAVVPGAAYIVTSQAVQQMQIPLVASGKVLILGIFLMFFSLITTFLLAVYTELRVRKIAMLEAMAAARKYLLQETTGLGIDLTAAITTVVGVQKCPKFLRRPSEDWYMLCLMSALGGLFWASSLFSIGNGLATTAAKSCWIFWGVLWGISVAALLLVTYWHLSWVVRFCHEMDLRRETKYGPSDYDYMIGKRDTIPMILRPLDKICAWIECRHARAYQH